MADSLPLGVALELLDDSEVYSSDVLGEDDDIMLFSVASCYVLRNLHRVCDYVEGTTFPFFDYAHFVQCDFHDQVHKVDDLACTMQPSHFLSLCLKARMMVDRTC